MARDEQRGTSQPGTFVFVRPRGTRDDDDNIDEVAELLAEALSNHFAPGTYRTPRAEAIVGTVSPAFLLWRTSVQSSNAKAAARSARGSVSLIEQLVAGSITGRQRRALERDLARARKAAGEAEDAARVASREYEEAHSYCNKPEGDELRRAASGHHWRAWDAKEQAYKAEQEAADALESAKKRVGPMR